MCNSLDFWEKLGTAMRQVRNFLGNAHEDLLEQPMLTTTSAIRIISEMYPFDPPIRQEVFSKKLQELVEAPTLPLAKWSLQSTDRLLQAKARELSADSARTFRKFIDNACTFRGAAIGHAIINSGGQRQHTELRSDR